MSDYEEDTRCSQCKDEPCQCCPRCGAGPNQACEEECGLNFEDDNEFWNNDTEFLKVSR